MAESTQHKLDRVRPPRVQITYDVEIGGAIQKKELPLVVGIMSDLTGATINATPLKDRKFVEIDRDNFNDVMARMTPGLQMRVKNTLKDDGSEMGVALKFNSMDDFEPARVVAQVPALAALLETREKLRDLMSKADRSQELENLLEQVLRSENDLKSLSGELGIKKSEE